MTENKKNNFKMNLEKQNVQAAWVSFVVSILILSIKFYAYIETQSIAVLSDAMESIVNVVASIVALFVMKAVAEPADEEHPYGHGKLEYFSAAFEGGLITFASIIICYESFIALFFGTNSRQLEKGLLYMSIAALLNMVLGSFLIYTSKKNKSEALSASGHHVLSDVWTTVGVLIGLFLVYFTGLGWLDAFTAILVSIQLGFIGWKIIRSAIGGLIDEKDPQVLKILAQSFEKHRRTGLIDVHHLKIIRSGSFHHIDAHIVIPEFWDIGNAHQITNDFEHKIVEDYPYDGEIVFHLDPCVRSFCSICEIKDCSIRARPFAELRKFSPEQLIQGPIKDPEMIKPSTQ